MLCTYHAISIDLSIYTSKMSRAIATDPLKVSNGRRIEIRAICVLRWWLMVLVV